MLSGLCLCLQCPVQGGGREGSAFIDHTAVRVDVVRPECGLQPAQQEHLQLLPLPVHRQRHPCCCGAPLLLGRLPGGSKEGILWQSEPS